MTAPADARAMTHVDVRILDPRIADRMPAYATSGSAGLRNPSVLQRCFRDMCVGAQHIYVDPDSLAVAGPMLLETWRRDAADTP